ncbi:BA14K-like protein [Hoeflea marina]|uniref:Lectin-like protein BA14k n=1 Tax=Hoeflea marina TaxID=274592 RepID=A0A317PJ44_9HYPH|nr:BA14K family protein [Hoeflea marina]PWV97627.1 BA14K-like protein [Hoeflea marina]
MRTITRTIAIAVISAVTAIAPLASAHADGSWNNEKYGRPNLREMGQNQNQQWKYRNRSGHYGRHYGRHYRHNDNSGVALGILGGLAAGAIIGGAINNNSRGVQYSGSIEPWTPAWYRYCDNRYRSFNDRTGTYRGYDGRDHFCVAN